MTLAELVDDPGLLISGIVITLTVLWLWDKACQRFWRWWHR